MDMNKSSHMPIILGRPFTATAGAEINIQAGTISFHMCGERVDFCSPPPIPSSAPISSPPPAVPMHTVLPNVVSRIKVFDGDGGPCIYSTKYDAPLLIPTSFVITTVYTGEVMDPTPPFHTSTSTPPMSSLCTIWR